VAIIGCSSDNISANAKFAADNHFAFPLLSDTDLVVALKYGAAASAGDGKARRIAALIDERGHVAKVWDPVGYSVSSRAQAPSADQAVCMRSNLTGVRRAPANFLPKCSPSSRRTSCGKDSTTAKVRRTRWVASLCSPRHRSRLRDMMAAA